jgi:simple sugar transport system permease protein
MRRHLSLMITAAVFLAGFLFCALSFRHFASTGTILGLLTDGAYLGIVAAGMTFVIISGGIDLSVGSVIGFTTVFLALAIQQGVPPLVAFAAALAICAAFGAAMGALIHFVDLPPFIVTLAGMFLARGAALLLSTESLPIQSPLYDALAGKIPWVMLAVVAASGLLLHVTRFGAMVYALGGGRSTTALMGVKVGGPTIRVYLLSSLLAGTAGIVFSLYTGSGNALAATGVELDAIAAAVIGGTLLSGGVGTMAGTFLGVLIEGLVQTYINFDGTLSSWWAKIATGFLLFAFIGLQQALLARGRRPKSIDRGQK